ncbi:MAG: hypothetical protein VX923_03165 [Pseudomonadota bacterium]|nr:hypothetical protein [Pseudomonadota bacterium]
MKQKNILVLARRDHSESMRVAAGLTISGHKVRLVFMTGPIKETEENLNNMELLELSDIVPETTIEEMSKDLTLLKEEALSKAITSSDFTVNL